MKIVLSGFEPFAGRAHNGSWQLLESLPESLDGDQLIKAKLPVVHQSAWQQLCKKIELEKPELVISFGEGARETFALERCAVNWNEYPLADNNGNQVIEKPIRDDGQQVYFSRLPLTQINQRLKEMNLPTRISLAPATAYLCNELYYQLMHYAQGNPRLVAGFIHVPQAGDGNQATLWPAETTAKIVPAIIAATKQALQIRP